VIITINQPSTINHQPSTINHQPPPSIPIEAMPTNSNNYQQLAIRNDFFPFSLPCTQDDRRTGKGRLTFQAGSVLEEFYDGDWVTDEYHGEGTYSYRRMEGTVYSGAWVRVSTTNPKSLNLRSFFSFPLFYSPVFTLLSSHTLSHILF
jgi:hypothetical protein